MNKIDKLERSVMMNSALYYCCICMAMVLAGGMLNVMAVATNDGRMPVYTDEFEMSTDTHFTFTDKADVSEFMIVDYIRINLPFSQSVAYYSIGDIIMVFSMAGLVVNIFWIIIKLWRFNQCHSKINGTK